MFMPLCGMNLPGLTACFAVFCAKIHAKDDSPIDPQNRAYRDNQARLLALEDIPP